MKPRLLDLYCGAGGAGYGYHQAGFEVVGVDIKPQKHYPFPFYQGDAIGTLGWLLSGRCIEVDGVMYWLSDFDAIHASPPCQGYSIMRNLPWLKDKVYPLLIDPTRALLEATGLPWVIENVMGARLPAGWLCGTMFGLPFYRHRYFYSSFFWMQPAHPRHQWPIRAANTIGGRARDIVFSMAEDARGLQSWPGRREGVAYGHAKGSAVVATAMGIDWMNRDELTQAVPPAYCRFIGEQMMKVIVNEHV